MTWSPLLPVWLLITIGIVLVAFVGYGAIRADRAARVRWLGRLVVLLALVAALARPGVGTMAAEVADESVDILFVVDNSASSAAEDWDGVQPRYTGMRADIAALAAEHPGARYSLVSFGSSAVQRLPFTTDATALTQTLETMQPEAYRHAQGSSIGVAAELVEDIFVSAQEDYPDRVRVLYYLGDGEQTAEGRIESFSDSKQLIQGGAVFGYGTSRGAAMEKYDAYGGLGDMIQDRSGNVAKSVIDEENLREIAAELDVDYQLREAGDPIQTTKIDAARGQSLSADSSQVTSFPIYWVFALVVVGWMLVETWVLVRSLRHLRAVREAIE